MSSTPASHSKLNEVSRGMRFLAAGLALLGVLSIVLPRASGMTIGLVVGILLLIAGIARVTFAWIANSLGSMFRRFTTGVLAILAGGVMILQPETDLDVITMVATVFFIADGVSQIAISLRLAPGTERTWVIISGTLSFLLGVLIWSQWPASGAGAIGQLVGVKLIMDAVAMVAVAATIQAVGKTRPS